MENGFMNQREMAEAIGCPSSKVREVASMTGTPTFAFGEKTFAYKPENIEAMKEAWEELKERPTNNGMDEDGVRLLTEKEVSSKYKIPKSLLAKLRKEFPGTIEFKKIGKTIVYREDDVERYVADSRV